MAAGEKIKAKYAEFKERNRARAEKAKRVGKVLVGAGVGGAIHGGIKAKTKGKTIGGSVTYPQAATGLVTLLAIKDERLVGPAAGAIGATASNAVEAAIERADANQRQQQPGAPAALPAAMRAAQPAGAAVLPAAMRMAPPAAAPGAGMHPAMPQQFDNVAPLRRG